ncbi:hypothetical protein FHS10_002500 [Mucilaginibacter dorajii]|uniref:Uncharacterized protein n=1 Tax=Mucilaginibacter dorajii TaxID=692994 RepID=A0ABP7P623_9SPHI|nr:hypothetical protein [Mucilaginibacter dorajii]
MEVVLTTMQAIQEIVAQEAVTVYKIPFKTSGTTLVTDANIERIN